MQRCSSLCFQRSTQFSKEHRERARRAAQPSGTKHFDRFSSTFHNNIGARYKPVKFSTFGGSLHICGSPSSIKWLLKIVKKRKNISKKLWKIQGQRYTSAYISVGQHHHICSMFYDYYLISKKLLGTLYINSVLERNSVLGCNNPDSNNSIYTYMTEFMK